MALQLETKSTVFDAGDFCMSTCPVHLTNFAFLELSNADDGSLA